MRKFISNLVFAFMIAGIIATVVAGIKHSATLLVIGCIVTVLSMIYLVYSDHPSNRHTS